MKKTKVLYLLHIDWDWIKQRPQFIAEGLAEKCEITCVYPLSWRFSKKTKNRNNEVHLIPIPQIPFNKNKIINKLNRFINHAVIKCIDMLGNYDVIFIPSPWLYSSWMKKKNVIYDCMDNYKAFMEGNKRTTFIKKEREIVDGSKVVLASSKYLIDELAKEYNVDRNKINLVRNGYSPSIREVTSPKSNSNKFKICYFGTIASWFDFEAIKYCLINIDNLEFHLAGPVDNIEIPAVEGIIYDGVIKHEKLGEYVSEFDCLIMPFVLNDIIEAVDPVKLYEYINFNKNILCIRYDEITRFDEFVHFYASKEELLLMIQKLVQSNGLKYSNQQRIEFLSNNTWQCRTQQIYDIIVDSSQK